MTSITSTELGTTSATTSTSQLAALVVVVAAHRCPQLAAVHEGAERHARDHREHDELAGAARIRPA